MIIRRAVKKDIKRIVELMNDKYLRGIDRIDMETWDEVDIWDFMASKAYRVFVCEIDKKVVGVSIIQFHKIAHYIEYSILVVDKRYRGKKIGKGMVEYVENFARKNKVNLIWCITEEENEITQKMFKKRGYKEGKKFIYLSKIIK